MVLESITMSSVRYNDGLRTHYDEFS